MRRALIACEFSGTVRDAFAARGWDAWSCDLLPSERPGQHYECDVSDVIGQQWDLLIAHPPCTFLCSSGLHWNGRIPGREDQTDEALRFVRMLLGAPVRHVALENPVGRISTAIRPYDQKVQPWQFGHNASKGTCLWLKNLPPLTHTEVIAPSGWQAVKFAGDMPLCECCGEEAFCPDHQEHFGDCECIGPTQDDARYKTIDGYLFASTDATPPRPVWGNQTPGGQNKLCPSPDRWALRSRTYSGIARAMAEQWSASIETNNAKASSLLAETRQGDLFGTIT